MALKLTILLIQPCSLSNASCVVSPGDPAAGPSHLAEIQQLFDKNVTFQLWTEVVFSFPATCPSIHYQRRGAY